MAKKKIDTEGGSYIGGNVDTGGGNFAGRDHITNTYLVTPHQASSATSYTKERIDSIFEEIKKYENRLVLPGIIGGWTGITISVITIAHAYFYGYLSNENLIYLCCVPFFLPSMIIVLFFQEHIEAKHTKYIKEYIISLNMDKAAAVQLRDTVALTKWRLLHRDKMKKIEELLNNIAKGQ